MNTVTETTQAQPTLDTWRRRRRMMWTVLWFCMGVIAFCLWKSPAAADTAITMSFGVIGVIVLGYVFGAVLDDNAISIFSRK